MANIIALQGRGNCGKTTTLKLLIEKIIKKYSVSVQKQDWKKRHKDEVLIRNNHFRRPEFRVAGQYSSFYKPFMRFDLLWLQDKGNDS